jgi:hypothetical protein
MEPNYLVKNPSHAMIVEAIKTLPGKPESINLEFFADGVQFPKYPENEEMIKEYIETCKYQNIIPFSNKRIRYSFGVEEKIPENSEAMKMFFSGGRTNRISMEISQDWRFKEISKFQEILFPSLLENNYKVSYGEIVISGHKTGSHESEGYDSDLALRINYGSEKGLGLLLDDSHRQANEEKLTYQMWFQELKEKYKIRN